MARARRPGRGRVASPGGAGGPRAGASAAAARAGTRRSRRRRRAKAGAAACGGARWRRCSDRGGAGGPRDGAARRQGRLGGLGALGGGARASARAARGGTAAAPWRSRRRGGGPTPAMRDSSGDRVGKEEGVASELTAGSIWSESGRRSGIDGEGWSSTWLSMAAAAETPDSAGGGARPSSWRHGGASGRGRAAWGAENRAGWRGWSARRPAMALLELGLTRAREEGEGEGKIDTALWG